MSIEILVQIPSDDEDEDEDEKSSEHKCSEGNGLVLDDDISYNSSASATFIHYNNYKKQTKDKNAALNITGLDILTASRKSITNGLLRIVSLNECEILKNNIVSILTDNNYDIFYEFNLSEFMTIFNKISISAQDEIIKFFNLFQNENELLSFDFLLNNDSNFNQLLETMRCVIDPNIDDTNINNKINQINQLNYMQYIDYQRNIIQQQRNEMNDIYKPIILYNKEMELKIESLFAENMSLSDENNEYRNEINLLEQELKLERDKIIMSQSDESEKERELNAIFCRRISTSLNQMQENNQFLENELSEMQTDLKLTKNESNTQKTENLQLTQLNYKLNNLNYKLTNKLKRKNKETNDMKEKINNMHNEINSLKYELFEKGQNIENLNNLYADMLLQLQFYTNTNKTIAKNKSHRSGNNSYEFRVTSIRSSATTKHSSFDIFNDLLLSPNHLNYNSSPAASHYTFSNTPNCNYTSRNNFFLEIESNEFKVEIENDTDKDKDKDKDDKDKIIEILRNDLNKLQNKYDCDIIEMEMRQQKLKKKKKKRTKSIGIQTKQLGFWQRLFSEIKCMPIDENFR